MREIVITSPAKNALSTAVMEGLSQSLRDARGEPVLLTGAGDVFSAGLDLAEVAGLDAARARRMLAALENLVEALFTYPGPTVALVNGHAIAGGCVLAVCCDHRVATSEPRTRIGLNEVAIGLVFPPRTLAAIRGRLTRTDAERVILGAGLHDPLRARELGLVDEVADDARAVALARLEALGRNRAAAYASAKARLRAPLLQVTERELRALEEECVPCWTSEETRAVAAKLLKR